MIDNIAELSCPEWLNEISQDNIHSISFDVKKILQDSLYYPAAGFDGNPIKYFSKNTYSFIYVDYSVRKENLLKKFTYSIVARRSLTEKELAPNGWSPDFNSSFGNPAKFIRNIAEPFCEWIIFKSGGLNFSLIYLCADGVATYQALYIKNNIKPKFLAFIQPGTIHGNWTDFTNPNSLIAKSVISNPAGMPEYLINGGFYQRKGDRLLHKQPCWPHYENFVIFLLKSPLYDQIYMDLFRGKIIVWKLSAQGESLGSLLEIPEEIQFKFMINGRLFPKIRYWHNLFSILTHDETESKIPNPLIFENCKGAELISKTNIFAWHLNWANRKNKNEIVKHYLEKLEEKNWEHQIT